MMSGHYEENVFYIGEFDDGLELIIPALTHEIKRQAMLRNGKIDLYVTSPGGTGHLLQHMVALVEVAKNNGVMVRTIVTSIAYSAGSMLAITGTPGLRYIARDAEHLVHYGSIVGEESTPLQSSRATKWRGEGFKRIVKHYNYYSQIPNLEEQMKDDLFFVPAHLAKKWKMADEYLDKMPVW